MVPACNTQRPSGEGLRKVCLGVSIVGLSAIVAQMISPFLPALAWAFLVVLVTWPMHAWTKRCFRLSPTSSALVTTAALAATLSLAVLPLLLELMREAQAALGAIRLVTMPTVEESLRRIPIIGARIADAQSILTDGTILSHLVAYREELFALLSRALSEVAGAAITLTLATFFSFFLYRDGPALSRQVHLVVEHLTGPRGSRFITTATAATRAAVYGTAITAFVQGLVATLGFWLFGAPTPVLLGLATMLLSFIPFGAPLVYLPVSAYMIVSGAPWHQGALLILWGAAFVSTADNILRPYFISQAAQLSIALIFLGVLGGLMHFGPIGIFLGPAVIAVARSVWLSYLDSISSDNAPRTESP